MFPCSFHTWIKRLFLALNKVEHKVMRFSSRWQGWIPHSEMWRRVVWFKCKEVSKELSVFIFRFEESLEYGHIKDINLHAECSGLRSNFLSIIAIFPFSSTESHGKISNKQWYHSLSIHSFLSTITILSSLNRYYTQALNSQGQPTETNRIAKPNCYCINNETHFQIYSELWIHFFLLQTIVCFIQDLLLGGIIACIPWTHNRSLWLPFMLLFCSLEFRFVTQDKLDKLFFFVCEFVKFIRPSFCYFFNFLSYAHKYTDLYIFVTKVWKAKVYIVHILIIYVFI